VHFAQASRAVKIFRGNFLYSSGLEVQPEQAERIIGQGDFLAIGRPDSRTVKAGSRQLEFPDRSFSILRAKVQFIFARFVGEVSNGPAIGRPDRIALVPCWGLGKMAVISFLSGESYDFAANSKTARAPEGDRSAFRIQRAPLAKRSRRSRRSVEMPTTRRLLCPVFRSKRCR